MSKEEDNHSKFLGHLNESNAAVMRVAKWFNEKGYHVGLPAISKANTHSEWKESADFGDLTISQRIEVKHLGIDFKDKGDWPFGKKFIVCAKHSFDRATPKPYAYIILNNKMTRAAIVMTADYGLWYVEKRTDSRYEEIEQEFYFAPIETVKFVGFV